MWAHIPAHDDLSALEKGHKCPSDFICNLIGQGISIDTPYIICLENSGHAQSPFSFFLTWDSACLPVKIPQSSLPMRQSASVFDHRFSGQGAQ
jgi:hypothetical protein